MIAMTGVANRWNRGFRSRAWLAPVVLMIVGSGLSACGSSSSSSLSTSSGAASSGAASSGASKPSYCSDLTSLEQSVKALTRVKVLQTGASGLRSALTTVENDTKAVVTSMKGDFSSQVKALDQSLHALPATAKQITSSPTTAGVGKLTAEISAVAMAAKNLQSAASTKCG